MSVNIEELRRLVDAVLNAKSDSDAADAGLCFMQEVGPMEVGALLAELDRLEAQRDRLLSAATSCVLWMEDRGVTCRQLDDAKYGIHMATTTEAESQS